MVTELFSEGVDPKWRELRTKHDGEEIGAEERTVQLGTAGTYLTAIGLELRAEILQSIRVNDDDSASFIRLVLTRSIGQQGTIIYHDHLCGPPPAKGVPAGIYRGISAPI